jgi:hypothetical protein
MATLQLPSDIDAEAVNGALRWHGDDPTVRAFLMAVGDGIRWSPMFPRMLLRYAEHNAITVDGVRLITLIMTGFGGEHRLRRLQEAIHTLRQARDDVASGKEAGVWQGNIWTVGESEPARLPQWGEGEPAPGAIPYPSPPDGMSRPPTAIPASPVAAPAAAPSPRPTPSFARPLPYRTRQA